MKVNLKKKLWPLWIFLGAVPGSVLWLFLVNIGYAGEFAGLIAGFGAMAVFRWSGAELKYSRLIIGSVMLSVISVIVNHIAYALDIYNKFSENWFGAAGSKFSFFDASRTVFSDFFIRNAEGLRKFYIEAAVQGILCSLLFWIALFIYYRKVEELESEK